LKAWTAVVVLTGLLLVMLVGVNVHLWRRMKAATAAARAEKERAGERDGESVDG
jgi:hypothetical protein